MSVAREMNGILFGYFFLKRLVADLLRDKGGLHGIYGNGGYHKFNELQLPLGGH